jgi:hypothetical protein
MSRDMAASGVWRAVSGVLDPRTCGVRRRTHISRLQTPHSGRQTIFFRSLP